ncbi:hypothetical protein QL285_077661 [Trifolium repens]|nr:hypothetical protein QL285_077661 [Trifolium repens]
MNGNGGMSTKLPVFDGKNWNRWMKQMLVLFGAQDVLELVIEGYVPVAADATDAQKLAQKDTKKKDQRTLFYIHQCVDENVFEKIADSETAKAAWDTLVRCYGGDASLKKVKLQSLRRQYENLNMKNNEKVPEYISRMIMITNEMKACGETLSEQVIIEKVLRSLTPQFDYIVVAIEHSKDLSSMRIEELQSSLEAQELRLTERNSEREVEQQALKAASEKKYQKKSWSKAKNRSDGAQKPETSTSDKQKYQKGKKRFDKTKVRCYCCQKLGHFAADCRSNKERESEETNMARSSNDEPVLLMAYESDDDEPVKLTFSDSEEVSEDDYEIGVRLYDSESESEVSEDESESEDDSEDEEVSEPESSEDESEDEGDSEGSDSEGSDSEGSDSEGSDSEGGRTSDNISDARASEGETSGSPTSKEEEDLEGRSDSESDGGDDSDGASDSDPESSGDSDGGDPDSEDVGSGGQASEFDHAFGGNHDFEGRPSEGGASKGSPASNNGHVSKGETSEGRVSRSVQDSGGQDSEGGASGVGCPASDTVPELEEDCDSGIDYGASSGVQGSEWASSEVRSSEFVTTDEILEKQVWLQAMTEELETLRYDFLGPSGVKTNAELIDSDWSEDKNLRRGQVQNEVLEAAHCSAQKQLADALMKDVKAEHFIHLRDEIGVAEIEFAEYELRNGSGSNSYSEAVRRRNFCGHYSEAVLLRSSRASEVISQKQKKKQKLKLKQKKKLKQKEKQKQKLKLKEKQKARSKQKLLMRIQKSKSLFNFWSVSLCVNIN